MPNLKFRFSTRELGFGAQRCLMKHRNLARVAMRAVRDTVLKAAVDRCPKKEGNLAMSITGDVVEMEKSFAATCYIPINAPCMAATEDKDGNPLPPPDSYAVWIHEGFYNLGKNSLEKQKKVGVKVGRKFITRAIDDKREEIIKNLERCVKL